MKILIVDDSQLARMGIIKYLKILEPSAELFEAESGLEAIEVFKRESPSVVFMDLTMPGMSGYEAIERIMPLDSDVKIVVVSADIQKIAEEKVIQLGAKMLIKKPINQENIKDILISINS